MNGPHSLQQTPHIRPQGFTLIEILVVTVIFAFIGVVSASVLYGEINAQEKIERHNDALSHWQRGMRRLANDLDQVVDRTIREEYDDIGLSFEGEEDTFTFTRNGWSNPLLLKRSFLQRIEYKLEEADEDSPFYDRDNRGQQHLYRYYWTVLDRAQDTLPRKQLLLPYVSDVEVFYLNDQGKWSSQWPEDRLNTLNTGALGNESGNDNTNGNQDPNENSISPPPKAVRLVIESEEYGELERIITLGRI